MHGTKSPNLINEMPRPIGHGVLPWFEVDGFDAALRNAKASLQRLACAPAPADSAQLA